MKRFLKSWSLLCRLAINDFKARYAGSSLGVVWAIAEPLVTVVIYWFVYTVAFGKNTGEIPYYLWLCAGIAPWFFISDGLRGMTSAYVDGSYLVKKMTFDNSVIPRARMLSSLISHLVFLAIVLILCIIDGSVRIDAASLIFMIFVSSFLFFQWGISHLFFVQSTRTCQI